MRDLEAWIRILPLVLVGGLAVGISAEAGCAVSPAETDPVVANDFAKPPPGCRQNEKTKLIGARNLCCTENGKDTLCFGPDAPRIKDACDTAGATAQSDFTKITFDTCVKESCSGD